VTSLAAGVRAAGAVSREVLGNGLTVIVRENPSAPVVAMTTMVRVGSCHETAATSGVTALLGRVLLKGTRHRSALELARAAEDAGGSLDATVDQEYAEVRARGLARHWPALLGLLHEVTTAPTLDPEEVERERAALLDQIRSLEDQPGQVATRLLARALFGGHPYALPTVGTVESVASLRPADLARHLAAHARPERIVLAVSGDVPAAAVVAAVGESFGQLAPGAGDPPLPPLPARPAVARIAEPRPTEQAHVQVGWLAPPVAHPDYGPLRVLDTLLGGGMSSRLFTALREREGLAYAVGSYYPSRRLGSRLVAHIGTAAANAARAEQGILAEAARLREEPVEADELDRAKAQLTGGFDLDLRTNARQALYLGLFELLGVGHGFVTRYRPLVEAVTSADVQRAAGRYLVDPAVAVVGST
jgi:predicted Zn-dependent peptidase